MFDRVRIRATPETEPSGYAGCDGTVMGVTTPSITGVEVLGDSIDDVALNVEFDEAMPAAWFCPDLVEFVDHGGEPVLEIGGSTFTRQADGDWQTQTRKPWWRFWAK